MQQIQTSMKGLLTGLKRAEFAKRMIPFCFAQDPVYRQRERTTFFTYL